MPEKDYSQTPLVKKLGIKPGARVLLVNAPESFTAQAETLLPGAVFMSPDAPELDVIVLFGHAEAELQTQFAPLAARLHTAGGLWVAYPKKAAKITTDLTFENVQRIGLDARLVDNKSCAIDATYTGLRFVYRLEDRPKKAPKRGG